MKRLLLLLFPFIFLISCGTPSQPLIYQASIVDVHDGDTFKDSEGNDYRLFGVDTPEISNQFDAWTNTGGLEGLFAVQAREYAKRHILNRIVKVSVIKHDRYSRLVAKITYGNKDLGIELIKAGLARVAFISDNPKNIYYTDRQEYMSKLLLAQYKAYNNDVGIWKYKDMFKTIFPKS